MESILTSVKEYVGPEDSSFDTEIIDHINTAFSEICQMGVGPPEGFRIEDASNTWDEFLPDDPRFSMVRDYIKTSVKLVFDPPLSSSHLAALEKTKERLEFRLQVAADDAREEE